VGCNEQRNTTSSVFGSDVENDSSVASCDLYEIQQSGELIATTLSGPDTYFEYRGRGFGLQHDLVETFAKSIGVRLRIEVAHDTIEMLRRLKAGEVDIVAMEMPKEEGVLQTRAKWLVGTDAPLLAEAVDEWYKPGMADSLRNPTTINLPARRNSRPPMLDAAAGRISEYDALFQRNATSLGWDWRLLAAQCYQESGFDPKAVSWAGAKGLMQLMPATASLMEVSDVFDANANIEGAVRYLRQLDRSFSDISPQSARIPYVLAAYNGGANHVRDAMALTQHQGGNPRIWRDVEPRLLLLAQPAYYQLSIVKYGYLRGSETHDYVRQTMDRWAQYRGQARHQSGASTPQPAIRKKRDTIVVQRPVIPL